MKIKQTINRIALALLAVAAVFSPTAMVQAQANENCAETSVIMVNCEDDDSGVWQLLIITLNILTAGVGIAAVGGIVWGALKYASAKENADQVKQAKDIIKNVVIGILLYAGMYLMINFLIPGGLFS